MTEDDYDQDTIAEVLEWLDSDSALDVVILQSEKESVRSLVVTPRRSRSPSCDVGRSALEAAPLTNLCNPPCYNDPCEVAIPEKECVVVRQLENWEDRPLCGNENELTQSFVERQKVTGSVLYQVRYVEGDMLPSNDVYGLRSDENGRAFVTGMLSVGPARRTGVRIGDELIAVNGSKTFVSGKLALSTQAERLSLKGVSAPATLDFMGFIGKFPAEVQLKRQRKCAGMESSLEVWGVDSCEVQLCDEIVFRMAEASLLLITEAPTSLENEISLEGELSVTAHDSAARLYELHPAEAKTLLTRALWEARLLSGLSYDPNSKGNSENRSCSGTSTGSNEQQ